MTAADDATRVPAASPASTDQGNLTDDVLDRLARDPDAVALARRGPDGWSDVSIGAFHADVVEVAKGLLAAGVRPGDRVALLSRTRYEWTLVDYAIWWVGAVTVPIYETSSAEQISWILSDSGAVAAVVESPHHRERVDSVRQTTAALQHVWSLDDGGLDTVRAQGSQVDDAQLEQARSTLTSDSLATLIYTSGTTGRPKGCRLTHGNFRAELFTAAVLCVVLAVLLDALLVLARRLLTPWQRGVAA